MTANRAPNVPELPAKRSPILGRVLAERGHNPDLLPPSVEVRALCHAVMQSLHEVRLAAFEPVEAG